ncbi:TetR/AcrR family transcriptional regulator [Gordonia desulfuricans]|uniref:TetR/AcrR family transcriptional regulator n=1 Tax=Gordonia desulfuricans TaxID=89051 RepID=A0A7K3LPN3_9ACTN|nr:MULTISPECIES: TetR/AcrR family transcriptional regulator [Gordonia]EMP14388.1 TetR family transcriptional regulator [Gordonia sp. NB41Y]NDK90021.1 TetR/AcrR family transcriptional regulator [Gordonia desulfuricans]WLP90821.1 TetR/AcrR family transcriptional regulator [Gordonia sp. NB41Y]
MTTTSGPRRGRPPKGESGLTRTAIVTATLAAIDRDGVSTVGMRSIARALGVDPKSLYNHVHGLDGLLDAVAEHVLGSVELPQVTGDLTTDLTAVAYAFRAAALAHPHAAALVLTRQLDSVEGLAPVQLVLATLRDAGCPAEESVHILRALLAAVIGALLREVEAGPTFGSTLAADVARRTAALADSGFPAVAEAAPFIARFDGPAEFEYAVGFAIDAVRARLRRDSDASGSRIRHPDH